MTQRQEARDHHEDTCATCGGKIFRYRKNGGPFGNWLHVRSVDWRANPHVAAP